MPFWWRRRRRYWWPKTKYQRRRRRRWPTRRQRTRYRRYRSRRARRRRRTRRKKVRRKRKAIPVLQWQPDSIRNCKIKGYGALLYGAEGTQYLCYTNQRFELPLPQYPSGGGFAVQLYSLQYLYEESLFKNNIWTASNVFTDLCRYLRCKLYLYRHDKTDFVISYNRQPPWHLTKYTYASAHPYMLLQSRHKKILLSKTTNPRGKLFKKLIIKPPKQMISKWFFQKQFTTQNLFQLSAAAASFKYPRLACCNENRVITIYYLNPQFYTHSTWAQSINKYWEPYAHESTTLTFYYKEGNQTKSYQPIQEYIKLSPGTAQYYASIQKDTGWFSKKILTATVVKDRPDGTPQANLPLNAARYNPELDNGKGNKVYLVSVLTGYYNKPTEDDLIFQNAPLWLIFHGFLNYIIQKKGKGFPSAHMFVIESPFITPQPSVITKNFFPLVDLNFTLGLNPYKAYISTKQATLWYPTVEHQIETINSIVELGPYIPKYADDRDSTWELPYRYIFYFKWGGPETPQQEVADPNSKNIYTVPDTITGTVQISNPIKQSTESLIHNWDLRRGLITQKALKRMYENLETDSDFQPDTEQTPPKRPRTTGELLHFQETNQEIQSCIQALYQEDEEQETPQTQEGIINLINKQQQQQQQLKRNILMLLQEIKHKQQMLQLTTGLIQ
nr:MAG: ORF1 [Torque teno midi virus]